MLDSFKNINSFVFDMDGVLIDSNPTHTVALRQFCAEHGFQLTEQQLKEKIYGRTNRDWLLNLFGDLPDETIRRYAFEKEALFRKIYTDIKPLDGLLSFLTKMDVDGIPRAIATSAPRENVDFTLEHTGMGTFFKTILDDSFVTKGKPDPQIYLKSAAALGLEPRNCVVFEDSLSGVKAGKAAGCKVVGLTTTHTDAELSETDFNIDNFNIQPKSILERLF